MSIHELEPTERAAGAKLNILDTGLGGRSLERGFTFFLNLYIQGKTTKLGLSIQVLQLNHHCTLNHFSANLQPQQPPPSIPAIHPAVLCAYIQHNS